ncbi:MAG: HNH endonuclease signature motif containing protein, partial [Mycobacterium sp.]
MSSTPTAEHEDPVLGAFDVIDAAVTTILASDPTRRSTAELVLVLRRAQTVFNRLPAILHREVAALRQQATPAELGDTLQRALAEILRISRSEANRLVDDAENLGPRTALSGEPMQPWLAATSAAQAEGAITAGHVAVIRGFMSELPGHINTVQREEAEQTLVSLARRKRPEEVRKEARDLFLQLDQDGTCPDSKPRAPKGEVRIGPQGYDGMSRISGHLTPEARATWEAINAKWAAPGACNPSDESPCIDEVTEQAAQRDGRTQPQRNHDALVAVGRAMLASGGLGIHHGLPATITVSTTLAELEARAGIAVTAGGTRLPISDVLRLARHASHYLVIYGNHGEVLHLGRTRRTASPAQQIVLYDRDRGCTRPGCTVPGYGCEAHHAVLDWANGGLTNIDDLAF